MTADNSTVNIGNFPEQIFNVQCSIAISRNPALSQWERVYLPRPTDYERKTGGCEQDRHVRFTFQRPIVFLHDPVCFRRRRARLDGNVSHFAESYGVRLIGLEL